jgi:WD40 repeat protein
MSISTDHKWVAYEKYVLNNKSDELIITDSVGNQQVAFPWETEWGYVSSWLDGQRLLIDVDTTTNGDASTTSQSSTFLALNPFTNERQILPPDFPNIFESQGFTGLVGQGYNQELDRVVYLQGDSAFLEPLHYVLWDINQKRTLASFEVVIEPTAIPSWSPDGSKFALAASLREDILQTWPAYELYITGRDGQITQLTNLTAYYLWVYIDDYSWSPDGRFIAFWFSHWSEPLSGYGLFAERYLAIVDTESNEVTNYCIEGNPSGSGRVPLPVWSPDGKQLVVESPSSEGHSQVVLIDLDRQLAVQIGEDMKPVGWLAAP